MPNGPKVAWAKGAKPAYDGPVSERARRLGGPSRQVQTYETGRRCRAPGCKTVLSRYTKGDMCWQHEQRSRPKPAPYI